MLDLVTVGDVMLDVHLPASPAGEPLHASIQVLAGGSAVNAALAAARLGARAAVVGAVGKDAAGRMLADALVEAGVEPRLSALPYRTGTCVYLESGVVADRGANAALVVERLPDARATLVSGFLDDAVVAAALAAASGLRAIDLQRPGAVPPPGADVVIGPALPLAELASSYDVVCATLGADGAKAVRGEERAQAAPPVRLPESPVGAGDAFAAAFVLALADGLPLQACLERGCQAAVA